MKKISIIYPDGSKYAMSFKDLGLDEDATMEEIGEAVNEEVLQNISWGFEIVEEG